MDRLVGINSQISRVHVDINRQACYINGSKIPFLRGDYDEQKGLPFVQDLCKQKLHNT